MKSWNFVGSRWWKFDFHTHTPASKDFKRPDLTAEDWLLGYMSKEIDCVAVTDHNSGAWIDKLKSELTRLEDEEHVLFRPLCLFPGVELSVHGGVHVLAIFDRSRKRSDIDALLGAVGYNGERGRTDDGESQEPISKVVDLVIEHGGIPIPAHVDRKKGLFGLQGQSLLEIFKHSDIVAMELCDPDYTKPESYVNAKTNWTEVRGSDWHGKDGLGTFTWVKMEAPSIEGLRLALVDGPTSISRDVSPDPNEHAEFVIEKLSVENAKYMGRPNPLEIEFSPFLTSVIGGRGTGKSTLVEFLRLALRRRDELTDALSNAMPNYFEVGGTGLLTPEVDIQVTYRKGETRYRLRWSETDWLSSLEEQDGDTGEWVPIDGEISGLFPVSIFSQKQIFELAGNPQGLLGIVDRDPDVDMDSYRDTIQDQSSECKRIAREITQLRSKLAKEKELKGKRHDLQRQIRQIQASGHKEALQLFRVRQQQFREIQQVSEYWQEVFDELRSRLSEIESFEVNRDLFQRHADILAELDAYQDGAMKQVHQINEIVSRSLDQPLEWRPDKASGRWWEAARLDLKKFQELRKDLERQGLDPQAYEHLLHTQASTERDIEALVTYKQQTEQLQAEYKKREADLFQKRKQLTLRRASFLNRVLKETAEIRIEVTPFGQAWKEVEAGLREILQSEGRFNRDFENLEETFAKEGWEQVKKTVREIRQGKREARDMRFQQHLRRLTTEAWVDFLLWCPEDALSITYGTDNRRLQEGSPGQKSAALLAFILSYGDAPLILDQPEDDLDNELIYSLIVKAIKETKKSRQVIVVTHNANIVVNGDSEYVHCLKVARGQTLGVSQGLQSKAIRDRICETMEGGTEAFEQRYKRILL